MPEPGTSFLRVKPLGLCQMQESLQMPHFGEPSLQQLEWPSKHKSLLLGLSVTATVEHLKGLVRMQVNAT